MNDPVFAESLRLVAMHDISRTKKKHFWQLVYTKTKTLFTYFIVISLQLVSYKSNLFGVYSMNLL